MNNRARLILWLLIPTAAGVYWHASLRVATGPDAGVAIDGNMVYEDDGASAIRIGTFNIHGCKGLDGLRDPDRVALDLAGFDFVGLNEVHGGGFGGTSNQAQTLGRHLAMAWLFAPAEFQWYGRRQFGNALVTRLPVTCWQRIPLPRKHDYSFRNMLLADVCHRGRTIRVLVTHVTQRDPRERRMQLDCVLKMFLALDEPAVLVGDLNTRRDDPAMQAALATPGVVDPVGELLFPRELEMIDWILVRGLRGVDAGIRSSGASDHTLIWAELEVATEPCWDSL